MNIPYVFKRCSKCGEWLVACSVNFHKQKRGKYGLQVYCKKCKTKYGKKYRNDNKDEILEKQKQYREANKDKIKQYYEANKDDILKQHKQYYEINKDKILKQNKQYYEVNKDKVLEQCKQYREVNRDKIAEYRKQYYEENKDKIAEINKQYRKDNKDKIAEINKQYYEINRDKIAEQSKQYRATPQGQITAFNGHCKRRLKEQNQGNGITKEQWLECMTFFDWKCAYSGESLIKENRTIDHIDSLNKGGRHEIWNLAPMCRSYNISKHDKDMLEWYQKQPFFSEERLQKIYEWQEYAFNKWHKEEIV